MKYHIFYAAEVVGEDIPNLDTKMRRRVYRAIEQKLGIAPETFGKPLRRSLKGHRKLRVGEYRVVFRIEKRTVKIFAILHRSVIYPRVQRRI